MAKSNSSWVDLCASLDDVFLQEHHQAYNALEDLPSPETQTPQMIMLIGDKAKRNAMQHLRFGGASQPESRSDVRLFVESRSVHVASPIFYGDCELHTASSFDKPAPERTSGDILRRSLAWRTRMPHCVEPGHLADLVYAKLMSPFATLICFFVDDFHGLPAIARTLASWLINMSNRPPDLPVATRPQVMIFLSDNLNSLTEKSQTQKFHKLLRKEAEARSGLLIEPVQGRMTSAKIDNMLGSHFGRIQVVALPSANSSNRKWRSIRARILRASEEVHLQRLNAQIAFGANHFKALFNLACDHFCTDIILPFNFIQASRKSNPVPSNFGLNIQKFIQKLEHSLIFQFAIPIIASALVLDGFPPGMHYFNPIVVFDQIYRQFFQIEPIKSGSPTEETFEIIQLANAIEAYFCKSAANVIEGRASAASSHKDTLFKFRYHWKELYSNGTCLGCLARQPEYALQCGHSICEPCVIIHGVSDPKKPWTLTISTCPLCYVDTKNLFRLKPPTAGVRVLSIDGGGIRGLVSIIWLKELQSMLQLPMPVYTHFDIAVGTSSGGMVLLGLYGNDWTIDECDVQFQKFAQLAFRSRLSLKIPFLFSGFFRRITEVFWSCIADSRYSSRAVTNAVQQAYGQDRYLFGLSTGTKVAITATTIDRSSTVLFSNYNSTNQSKSYRMIRPENPKDEMLVWEVARATSAAPPFFESYKGYHDGALGGHNNPVNLALWEQNTIWNRRSKQPDIVLSLGTGSRIENDASEDGTMSKISQLFLPRLVRSFMMLLDGQKTWVDLLNGIPEQARPRYHRLNISFPGSEPQLDNVECMRDLKKQVRYHASSRAMDLSRCADNILASLFYIELDSLPVFSRFKFYCHGRILCRLDAGTRELYSLVVRLKERQSRFYLHSQDHKPCVSRDLYDKVLQGEPYVLPIDFQIFSTSETIDFKIDGITRRPRSISNCPYIVADLVLDQGLHLVFGRSDHKRRSSDPHLSSKRRRYN